jgi:predicted nucleic acid-binding protein
MIEFLIDTNVISQILKGNLELTEFVNTLESAIDTTVYVECLQGNKSNQEKYKVRKLS